MGGGGGGGFRSGPTLTKQGILELKITNKGIFLKGWSFVAAQDENVNKETYIYIYEKREVSFVAVQTEKAHAENRRVGGFRAAHTSTALIWEYPLLPPPPTPPRPQPRGLLLGSCFNWLSPNVNHEISLTLF